MWVIGLSDVRNNPHKSLLLLWPILFSFTHSFSSLPFKLKHITIIWLDLLHAALWSKMMRLSSQVKFCFQKCQFHPDVTCTYSLSLNEIQKSSLPRILVVNIWVLQKVLARLTLIFHIPALSGFSWAGKVRSCFCAFSSLAVLGKPSLCLWEVHPKQTCQRDSDRSPPCPLTGLWCILILPPYLQ